MASDVFVIAALKAKPACTSSHHHNTKKKKMKTYPEQK
jgi:hypothetical protein